MTESKGVREELYILIAPHKWSQIAGFYIERTPSGSLRTIEYLVSTASGS
jgi:hypothetical protein